MRIACVDISPVDREGVLRHLEDAFASQRGAVGHLPEASLVSYSLDELLFVTDPGTIVLGPGFGLEAAFHACRRISETFPRSPLVIFFSSGNYSLRSLRRFEKFTKALFVWGEPSARLVHTLLEYQHPVQARKKGRLVVITGVKGGVGATSYAAGLAHAVQAQERSAVLVDLSVSGALVHYMGAPRWQSGEHATILSEQIRPEKEILDRLLVTAPNGTTLLLPPSGGKEVREMWLRDVRRFELSLSLTELLLEMFDLVIVDRAGAEGILPFALNSQADVRVLLSSNEPASVYLLHRELSELADIPGDGQTSVVVNLLQSQGLTDGDVFDFAMTNQNSPREITHLEPLPHDERARFWIGTGNTLYTEGSRTTQASLEVHARKFLGERTAHSVQMVENSFSGDVQPESSISRLFKTMRKALPQSPARKLLPAPERTLVETPKETSPPIMRPRISSRASVKEEHSLLPSEPSAVTAPATPSTSPTATPIEAQQNIPLDHAHRAEALPIEAILPEKSECSSGQADAFAQTGSLSLEQMLFAAGAVVLAGVAVPTFLSNLTAYLNAFFIGGLP